MPRVAQHERWPEGGWRSCRVLPELDHVPFPFAASVASRCFGFCFYSRIMRDLSHRSSSSTGSSSARGSRPGRPPKETQAETRKPSRAASECSRQAPARYNTTVSPASSSPCPQSTSSARFLAAPQRNRRSRTYRAAEVGARPRWQALHRPHERIKKSDPSATRELQPSREILRQGVRRPLVSRHKSNSSSSPAAPTSGL